MCDLGGERIFPCGEGDELCGQEESFQVCILRIEGAGVSLCLWH